MLVSLCRHRSCEVRRPLTICDQDLGVRPNGCNSEEEGVACADGVVEEADAFVGDDIGVILAWVIFGRVVVSHHCCVVIVVYSGSDEDCVRNEYQLDMTEQLI